MMLLVDSMAGPVCGWRPRDGRLMLTVDLDLLVKNYRNAMSANPGSPISIEQRQNTLECLLAEESGPSWKLNPIPRN
jgi:hypothetical protein